MDELFFLDANLSTQVIDPGKISRKIRARGGSLMLVEMNFAAGGIGALHEHPHEQVSYCLKGEFDFTIGDSTQRLRAGDSVFVPGGARHGVACLVEGGLIDVFTPQREDFLQK